MIITSLAIFQHIVHRKELAGKLKNQLMKQYKNQGNE